MEASARGSDGLVVDLARSRRVDRVVAWIGVLLVQAILVIMIIGFFEMVKESREDKAWLDAQKRRSATEVPYDPVFASMTIHLALNFVLLVQPLILWGIVSLFLKGRQRLHVTSGAVRCERRFSGFEAGFAAIDRLSVYRDPGSKGHQGVYTIETRDGRIGRFTVARPDFASDEIASILALMSARSGLAWLGGGKATRLSIRAFFHELRSAAGLHSNGALAGWIFRHAYFVRPSSAGVGDVALLRWSSTLFAVPLAAAFLLLETWLIFSPAEIMSSEVIGRLPNLLGEKREFMERFVVVHVWIVPFVLCGWVATCLGVNSIMVLLRLQERKRISVEADLRSAREMQSRLIPRSSPSIEGFDLSGAYVPARDVAGDYYDYVAVPERSFVVPVGDVSGKGVHAALLMTMVKGALLTRAQTSGDLKAILSALNTTIRQSASENMFVSMVLAGLEPGSRTVRIARAGHNPPLLVRANGEHEWLSPGGIALGIGRAQIFDRSQDVQEWSLSTGDVLLLYTDGITEGMNDRAEEYGEDRLAAVVLRSRGATAAGIRDAILEDLARFRGLAEPNDDVTMVVVKAT